jgi:deoxyadenosine kinase
MHIVLAGLIGAGKTTLARQISEKLNLPVYYEPVENNVYLSDFYSNPSKYSFPLQIYLFNKRFAQIQNIVDGVQDRSIYEDTIFARCLYESGMMEKRDYDTYMELIKNINPYIKPPDLIIYLKVSPEESMRRIQMRNRECESSITLEYLKHLYKIYEIFTKEIKVIEINYEQFLNLDEVLKKCNIN